ncbi:MAG: TolB-like protein [Lysobacterales bacterium]|jgi:TolB-like protein
MPENNKKTNLFTELARRGVYQAVGIYVAISWGAIEILITVSGRFGWPAWLSDASIILFLTALPLIVLLAWVFDLSGSTLKRVEPGSLMGKSLIAVGLMLVLAVSAVLFINKGKNQDKNDGYVPPTRALNGRPVIAVIPFQDLIAEGNSAVMALSFTDELINRINAHPDLMALDLQSVSSPLISEAQTTGNLANFQVTGSLRPAQTGIELRVRMTDEQGLVVWEHNTTRNMRDAMEARNAQEFVAGQVAASLGTMLTGADYCEPSDNAQASALYYRAKGLFAQRGAENVANAALLLENALELDPDFARAKDLLAAVYVRFYFHVIPDPAHYNMNEEELQAFLDTNPSLALAKSALDACPSLGSAYVHIQVSIPVPQTLADAVEILTEGLKRDPGNVPLLDRLVYIYLEMGHLEKSQEIASEYYQRDPLSPRAPHVLSLVERVRGNSLRALELEREAVDAGYREENAFSLIAYLLYVLGNEQELIDHFESDMERDLEHFLIDPLQLLAARSDPQLLEKLKSEAENLLLDADFQALRRLVGTDGGPPWLFELGDTELGWKGINQLSESGFGRSFIQGIWYKNTQRAYANQRLLELDTWAPEYIDFWNRLGPPDGCSWDGTALDCSQREQ